MFINPILLSLYIGSVLRRLVTLLSREARVAAENEALKRQAEGASAAAQQMMEEKEARQNLVSAYIYIFGGHCSAYSRATVVEARQNKASGTY